MKLLIVLSVFALSTAHAQNFSPSASGTGASTTLGTSPSSSGTLGTTPSASSTLGSPSAIGSENFNSGSTQTAPGNVTAPGAVIPGSPSSSPNINRANTAPTSVPQDTTLLNNTTPSGNPVQQSQEEFNSFPDTTAAPGTGTGSGTTTTPGSGSGIDQQNSGNPINQ